MIRFLLALTLPLYLLDQITKWWTVWNLSAGDAIEVVPGFFNWVHVHNTGAAFGILANNNGFFIGLSIVALLAITIFAKRGAFSDPLARTSAALLTAGVLGNLTDRIVHGHVVDFLDFILPWYGHWPAFNVADICICTAAGLFVVHALFEDRLAKS